jgi:hypothetical protein
VTDFIPPTAAESQAAANGSRQIVDGTGLAVKRSIPTIDVARAVMKSMEEVEEPTARRHARHRGLADGNPPYKQATLDALNLGYTTNVDFGEARGIINQKASQHFELFQEVPTLADFEVVDAPDDKNVQPRERHEDVVSEEFTRTLQSWSGFLPLMDFLRREADVVDVGVCAWRDKYDWRPVQISRGAFFPSPYARVDVETWDLAALADTLDAHYLLNLARDPEAAIAEGWNPDMIRRILVDVFVGNVTQDTQNGVDSGYQDVSRWEQLQMMLRNNDPACMAKMFDLVKVRHIFVKEPESGKISHLIMPTAICTEGDGFLCEEHDVYDTMSQALFVLPSNFGNGYLRSVRGLVSSIETHCDLSNRFLGRIFDAAMLAGTIMLKNTGAVGDARRLQLVRAGLVTLLPPGTEALQASSFAPPLAPLVQVRDLSSAVMRNNVPGVYRANSESWTENQPQKTAREVAELSTKEARADKAGVAFDYQMLQKLYRQIYDRMISADLQGDKTLPGAIEAREFVARCKKRGVPAAWLKPGALRLMITQTIGFGSWGVRLDVTSEVVGMRGLFDEAGSKNAVRDRLAALVGYRNVDRYLASVTRDSIPSNEKSIARLENNDAGEGSQIDVGMDQNHVAHFIVHAEPLQQILQAAAQDASQIDVMRALPALESLLSHMQGHLQVIAQDPAKAAFVQEGEGLLRAGIQAQKQLAKMAEEIQAQQQEQQAQQQQMLQEAQGVLANRDAELESYKAQKNLEIKGSMNNSLMEMRASRQAHSEAINARRTEADISLKSQKQAYELELARQKAEHEKEIARIKAERQ